MRSEVDCSYREGGQRQQPARHTTLKTKLEPAEKHNPAGLSVLKKVKKKVLQMNHLLCKKWSWSINKDGYVCLSDIETLTSLKSSARRNYRKSFQRWEALQPELVDSSDDEN